MEVEKSQTSNKLLWNQKYIPKKFHQLLSYEKINREILTWLKAWDPVVFKSKQKPKGKNKNSLLSPLMTPSK